MQIKFTSFAALTIAEVGDNNVQGQLYGSFDTNTNTLTITNCVVTPDVQSDAFDSAISSAISAGNLDNIKVANFISGDSFNLENFLETAIKTQATEIQEYFFCIFDTTLAPFSFEDSFKCFRFSQEFCDAFKKGKTSNALSEIKARSALINIPSSIEVTEFEKIIIADESSYSGRVNIPVTVKTLARTLDESKKNSRLRQDSNKSDYFKLICSELSVNFDIEKAELIYRK